MVANGHLALSSRLQHLPNERQPRPRGCTARPRSAINLRGERWRRKIINVAASVPGPSVTSPALRPRARARAGAGAGGAFVNSEISADCCSD
ncbi:hypothetical protein EVAR_74738_1 [Eumeta japonica]|uniref:Uncharacterized protein n=1 Tax=Eumeta variegata TaxID=151549 RepID=A0A4C1SSB3_EUMVA|nr:hypothetical protein EVAR_74738_1 [Eumeta japonica]